MACVLVLVRKGRDDGSSAWLLIVRSLAVVMKLTTVFGDVYGLGAISKILKVLSHIFFHTRILVK